MDITSLPIITLGLLAARLDRAADRVEGLAAHARHGTSASWRGGAAERHAGTVEEHVRDLRALAEEVRAAAASVRSLADVVVERGALLRADVEALGHVEHRVEEMLGRLRALR